MRINRDLLLKMHAKGWETVSEAAKRISVYPSTLGRWADKCLVTSTVRNGVRFVKIDSVTNYSEGGQ
jgi:transposase-like protein